MYIYKIIRHINKIYYKKIYYLYTYIDALLNSLQICQCPRSIPVYVKVS